MARLTLAIFIKKMIELNNIYNCDCRDGIKQLDDNSINLVCVSPPYNLGNIAVKHKIEYNLYEDNKEFKDYISFLEEVFSLLFAKLAEDGRVCINIGDQKNGEIPTHFFIIEMMLRIGYKV